MDEGAWFDSTRYIDDSQFMVNGQTLPDGGFEAALRLSLRILAEHIVLGFTINMEKSMENIVPCKHMTHLGCITDCSCKHLRYVMPKKRARGRSGGPGGHKVVVQHPRHPTSTTV